ncbi:hypothetical protein [Oleidesulfovibrio sp.]|uniref:hypothetical protein n=1 Tax=Oleidesulfovibrio sp. TaxID=2909707 RepID=UPI003A85F388
MQPDAVNELSNLLSNWEDYNGARKAFEMFKSHLESFDGVTFDFKARPGISYSLRAAHPNQQGRKLFTLVDIIDDDPAERWLSVCFYEDMINDPEELGDFVPGGLLGEDAHCLDLDEWDEERVEYIKARLSEAATAAVAK